MMTACVRHWWKFGKIVMIYSNRAIWFWILLKKNEIWKENWSKNQDNEVWHGNFEKIFMIRFYWPPEYSMLNFERLLLYDTFEYGILLYFYMVSDFALRSKKAYYKLHASAEGSKLYINTIYVTYLCWTPLSATALCLYESYALRSHTYPMYSACTSARVPYSNIHAIQFSTYGCMYWMLIAECCARS